MPSIFLCHASEDKAQVEPMQLALANAGCDVFYDQQSLPAGSDYHERIQWAIKRCDVFVFVASPASLTAGRFTLTELKFARERWPSPVDHVLPVVLQGTKPTELPQYLQATTALCITGNPAAEVRASLEAMLGKLQRRKRRRILALGTSLGCAALAAALVASRQPSETRTPSPSKTGTNLSEASTHRLGSNASPQVSPPPTAELPSPSHFQLDPIQGIFCERDNVKKPTQQSFDSVDINIGACNGSGPFGSRTYRVDWQPSGSRFVHFTERRGHDHCYVSDFSEVAPSVVQALKSSFEQLKDLVPCKVSIHATRQIRMSYINLHNESKDVAFLQHYNQGDDQRFEVEQVPTTNLTRSNQMESLAPAPNGSVPLDRLLEVASQYHYPGIPLSGKQ